MGLRTVASASARKHPNTINTFQREKNANMTFIPLNRHRPERALRRFAIVCPISKSAQPGATRKARQRREAYSFAETRTVDTFLIYLSAPPTKGLREIVASARRFSNRTSFQNASSRSTGAFERE
jgi:hypothetical protein